MIRHQRNNIVFGFCFLLFPFIQQRTFGDLPQPLQIYVELFYKYYTFVASTIIYIIFLMSKPLLQKQKKFFVLIICFWSIYFVSTLVNYTPDTIGLLFKVYIYIALVLLVVYGCKQWQKEFLTAASIIYGGWIVMTLFTFFIFPDGIYTTESYHKGHLLGDDNALPYVMLPGLVILSINSWVKKRKIDMFTWSVIILVASVLFRLWAASGMISVSLFGILLYLVLHAHYVSGKFLLFGLICIIFITLFGLSNAYIANIIENYIEKDVTISGRTILWAGSLEMISMRPILGYGGFFHFGSFFLGDKEYPCHTPYLQLLIDGGVLLFVVFMIIIHNAFMNVDKYKDNKIGLILGVGLFCMLVNYITEYSQLYHFFIIITMIFNGESLIITQKNGIKTRY